ncbi:macrolide family glycosyltransferase [Saccharopolyspora dendranthemae]|uniref:MGT family glycosyltransferase n=1 Tax=Saccharopolyspora dendranthemae TaxID=1181886 RepID=A0A561U9E1_9PSEU|nr:macrolide family glycosyltransferase [Saccharopolyspora dendranthemae]TWF95972.1 MGT family glycosyltransferase [Saccharopolyspora dendranthemae]
MKKHFLFTSVPAFGHVNPTLALVSELLDRGHRVTYAVGSDALETVRATGAEVLGLPTKMPDIAGQGNVFTPERMRTMMEFFIGDVRQCMPVLLEHFSDSPPDAVCSDVMTTYGRMLADKLGIPAVSLVPNFASNENFDLRSSMMAEHAPAVGPQHAEAMTKIHEAMTEVGEEFGVEAVPLIGGPPTGLNLVFLPEEFQLAHETFDERFRFIGPLVGDRADEDYSPADPQRPLVYIALGTAFNERPDFYRLCFEAFAEGPWQVALSIGSRVDPAALGEIPAHFDVRPSFPQPAVLRHAEAFVSHTGMNSTMESLHSGVPLIAVPQMPEQSANAARAEELGLGVKLDPETVTAAELRAAVDRMSSDPDVRSNLDRMRDVLRSTGGAPAGADAMEAFVV